MTPKPLLAALAVLTCPTVEARAENLYDPAQPFASIATDVRARGIGDIVTIVVYQSTEARHAAQNSSRTRRSLDASISGGDVSESGALTLDGGYAGQGEVRRSESFLTQISARVEDVRGDGDLLIAGEHTMRINGETTTVNVRGWIRATDIEQGNIVLSSRLADAQISYRGHGFVSRSAEPNVMHRLLSLLGLGG